jgi:DNA polymerase
MQVTKLIKEFDKLQIAYGDKNLDAIYGAGEIDNPKLCLVFMNPTGRNVSSNKNWKGLKAPWIGTKNVWKMFYQLGLFGEDFFSEINSKKPNDWDYQFSEKVYKKVKDNSIYITNLSKATQIDARPLKNDVFKRYLAFFNDEISSIAPKIIITFGNQVSSVLLNKNIKVSEYRKKYEIIDVNGSKVKVFPVYYPVGQGMRNIKKAKEDIDWIIKNQI